MSEKRRALGRGLGALIPNSPAGEGAARPVDVFFKDNSAAHQARVVSAPERPREVSADRARPTTPRRTTARRTAPSTTVRTDGQDADRDHPGQRAERGARDGNGAGAPAGGAGETVEKARSQHRTASGPGEDQAHGAGARANRLAARSGPRARSPSPRCPSRRSGRTPSSRARSSTRTTWPSWCTRSARSASSSRSSCDPSPMATTTAVRFELIMGERRWRATQRGRPRDRPGDHQGDRRRRPAARRPPGEPAPQPAQRARGGRGLPAAARGLRLHPRGARRPHRPLASADLQHPAPAEAPAAGGPPGRRRRAERRPRPRAARRWRTAPPWSGWPSGSSPRACRCAASRRSWRWAATQGAAKPRRPRAGQPPPAARRPGRPAVRPLRHPGQHRPGPAQGQAHRGVRVGRGPQPDRRPPRRRRAQPLGISPQAYHRHRKPA